MNKTILALTTSLALAASCGTGAFDASSVEDAVSQVSRVEPLSWWTGMRTPLQLLIQGPNISSYDVTIPGKGLKVKEVHRADSPD